MVLPMALSSLVEILLILLLGIAVVLGIQCVLVLMKIKRIVSRLDALSDFKEWIHLLKWFKPFRKQG